MRAAATGGGRSERGIYIMKELLFMKPVFKEAVWGGKKLRDEFGYEETSDYRTYYRSGISDVG